MPSGNTHGMTTRLARNTQLLQAAVAALGNGQQTGQGGTTASTPPPARPKALRTFTDVHDFNLAANNGAWVKTVLRNKAGG